MSHLYQRIRQILESARTNMARSVNTTQVVANWLIGREIVEEEQQGKARADYGEGLIRNLTAQLQMDYGSGYSLANVKYFRKFYLEYPQLAVGEKGYAVRSLLANQPASGVTKKGYAVRNPTLGLILCAEKNDAVVRYTLGKDQQQQIFASRYQLHLPTVAELQAEIRREVRDLSAPRIAAKERKEHKEK